MVLQAPKGAMPLQTLKPSTQGMDRTRIRIRFTATDFFRVQPPKVDSEADDIFKYGNDDQRAAKLMNTKNRVPRRRPPAIWLKMFGRVTKTSPGPSPGSTPKAKQAGKITETCHQGHDSIQDTDIYGLAHKGAVTADVASKDSHGADAEAQGEEGLSHGCEYHFAHAIFHDLTEVGNQIEFQSCACARQGDAADSQRTTRITSRKDIITLVMRSTPF